MRQTREDHHQQQKKICCLGCALYLGVVSNLYARAGQVVSRASQPSPANFLSVTPGHNIPK